jgi:hypothetical protein
VSSHNAVGALFFVGLDWAAVTHAVRVLDSDVRKVAAFTAEHTADGTTDLVRKLARIGRSDVMPVGDALIEGETLDGAGVRVGLADIRTACRAGPRAIDGIRRQ